MTNDLITAARAIAASPWAFSSSEIARVIAGLIEILPQEGVSGSPVATHEGGVARQMPPPPAFSTPAPQLCDARFRQRLIQEMSDHGKLVIEVRILQPILVDPGLQRLVHGQQLTDRPFFCAPHDPS